MKKIFLLLALCLGLYGTKLHESVIFFGEHLDKKYNVDKKLIFAYILTESNGKPYPILLKTDKTKLLTEILKDYSYDFKASGKYISIFPLTKTQAEFLYDFLKKYETKLAILDYDLGIMQINKRTVKRFNLNEKKVYLDIFTNMEVGTKVMRACYDTLKTKTSVENILECYNRGTSINWLNQSKRTYLKNFIKNFNEVEREIK